MMLGRRPACSRLFRLPRAAELEELVEQLDFAAYLALRKSSPSSSSGATGL